MADTDVILGKEYIFFLYERMENVTVPLFQSDLECMAVAVNTHAN